MAHINQIAMSVQSLEEMYDWYREVFGLLPAGKNLGLEGEFLAELQRLPDPKADCWWLVDRQEFFQLELFQYERPLALPTPGDWSLNNIGYNIMHMAVRNFEEVLARAGSALVGPVSGDGGKRRACLRDPEGNLVEVVERAQDSEDCKVLHENIPAWFCGITITTPNLSASQAYYEKLLNCQGGAGDQDAPQAYETSYPTRSAGFKRAVLPAGNFIVELLEPPATDFRDWPEGHKLNDQGILNVAVGFSDMPTFLSIAEGAIASGYQNSTPITEMGGLAVVYMFDELGFCVELLEVDEAGLEPYGFVAERA